MTDLNWTHNKPSDEGIYVCRRTGNGDAPPGLARVYLYPGFGLTVRWLGGGVERQDTLLEDVTGKDWLGPLPP